MPHYADGTPAAVGDIVKGTEYKVGIVGIVQSISPGSDTCNMSVARLASIFGDGDKRLVMPGRLDTITATCKEYLKIAMWLLAVAIVLTSAQSSFAQVVLKLAPGEHYLKVVVAADGSATASPLPVITLGPSPNPQPTPTPSPVPSELTARGKEIKAAVESVTGDPDRDNTAKGLALLYRELAKRVRTGQVADKNALFEMVKLGTDMFLTKNLGKWQPVRDKLSVQWSQIPAASSVGEYAGLLEEVANGLDASAPLRRISPELIDLIFRIIELILSLLNK